MTSFFVPDTPPGDQTDRAYEDLRRYAEITAGRPARARRIFWLSYRRGGADSETSVGSYDPSGEGTVHAIFDIGDGYAILWRGGHAIVAKRQTYQAVEFD
jgi:hypothetical protein